MYFIIQQILSLVKLLHSDNSDEKIAWAFVLGYRELYSLRWLFCSAFNWVLFFCLGSFLVYW